MNVELTELPGVLIVHSPVYGDSRGFFTEIFHADKFRALGLPDHFGQDNHSRSARHVLRGLHFQLKNAQGKLIRPAAGSIFDVAVDLRRSSSHFGKWVGVVLEAGDGRQVWIPPGFAHGFLVLSEWAEVIYKATTVWDPQSDCSIRWNDPDIGIRWPVPPGEMPTVSPKDAIAPAFSSSNWYE
jgi:dTDP-4-dehydrorhamnose 3,5-epimerase